jgi:hypothetical protein
MSERGEYKREFDYYLRDLRRTHDALVELGATRDAEFVRSFIQHVSRQGPESWGLSPRQQDVLTKIRATHGDLLTNEAKRKELVERRAHFKERLVQLKAKAEEAKDTWLLGFLANVERQIGSGRSLSDRQKETLQTNLRRYKVGYDRRPF